VRIVGDQARKKLKPETSIAGTNLTVGDLWSWAYSDIVCNTTRSVFAEFLVGSALGATESPRIEWDHVDFTYAGKKIEVKSSAYIQSWPQVKLSVVDFDIGVKKPWYALTNTYGKKAIRSADCYVFCLYPEKDLVKLNDPATISREMLDVDRWRFLVLPTEEIANDASLSKQKKIRLSPLEKKCKAYAEKRGFPNHFVDFYSLKSRFDAVLFGDQGHSAVIK
jgi:hypothetical protein